MTIKDRVFLRHRVILKSVRDRREDLEKGTILLHPLCAMCGRGIKDDFLLIHNDDKKSHLHCLLTEEEQHIVLSSSIQEGDKARSAWARQKIKSDLLRQQ